MCIWCTVIHHHQHCNGLFFKELDGILWVHRHGASCFKSKLQFQRLVLHTTMNIIVIPYPWGCCKSSGNKNPSSVLVQALGLKPNTVPLGHTAQQYIEIHNCNGVYHIYYWKFWFLNFKGRNGMWVGRVYLTFIMSFQKSIVPFSSTFSVTGVNVVLVWNINNSQRLKHKS